MFFGNTLIHFSLKKPKLVATLMVLATLLLDKIASFDKAGGDDFHFFSQFEDNTNIFAGIRWNY
ncbi:MAG: hypothetical protein OEV73_12210 [Desulfobulbaceae bacterium]|nr:hypothetical protein [Desulfobulbaceae bacterium]